MAINTINGPEAHASGFFSAAVAPCKQSVLGFVC